MSRRVLMFGWEYPPRHLGGLGVACQGIVRGLLHHGADVTLVLPHGSADVDPGMTLKSPTKEQLHTIRVQSCMQPYDTPESYMNRLVAKRIADNGTELYGNNLAEAVENYTAMAEELSQNTNPDVIHSHDWMTYEASCRAGKMHNKPVVAHIHATEHDRTHNAPNMWIAEQEWKGLHNADHVIAVSDHTKQIIMKEYGISANKITVVHNGMHTHAGEVPCDPHVQMIGERCSKNPMILFLGRLTVQKGPFHFLEAARIALNHNPDIRFVIAGEGYLLPELIDRACQMGLQENIIFAGQVTSAEATQLYRQASCFVMPSTSESFGLVALEAITHGAPVIVSKQSGVREVLPNAFHVDFWDTERLADCMFTVLRETPLALQLRSEAPRVLQKLTWANQAEKILSVYNHLVS